MGVNYVHTAGVNCSEERIVMLTVGHLPKCLISHYCLTWVHPKFDIMEKLDALDYAILNLLTRDAKIPYTEVGKMLGVSSGTIHVRMRKLEDSGVVKGSAYTVDYERLGYSTGAFLAISLIRDSEHDHVIAQLRDIRQIIALYYVTGDVKILARIICKNHDELRNILRERIYSISGVRRTGIYIMLEEYFQRSVELTDEPV